MKKPALPRSKSFSVGQAIAGSTPDFIPYLPSSSRLNLRDLKTEEKKIYYIFFRFVEEEIKGNKLAPQYLTNLKMHLCLNKMTKKI